MKKKITILALLLATMVTISCPGANRNVSKGKTLTVAMQNPKTILDMHNTQFFIVMSMFDHMVQTLYEFDEEFNVIPLLAEDMPTISNDGLLYSFKLKQGITFHDGSPLTTADVQFLFERMFSPDGIGISAASYDMILGAKEFTAGKATEVAGFRIIDDYTFEIQLEYPFTPFVHNLAMSYAGIIPKQTFLANQKDWGSKVLVGTGYYKLHSYHPTAGVVLKVDENYRDGRAPIDTIEFRFIDDESTALLEYAAGNLDIVDLPFEQYQDYASGKFANDIHHWSRLGTNMIIANFDDPAFSNPLVRQAFAYAIDRDAIIEQVYKGLLDRVDNFLPEGMPGRNPNIKLPSYDPVKAKELLAQAGFPEGVKVEAIYRSTNHSDGQFWTMAQAQAKEAGFDITVTAMDRAMQVELMNSGKIPLMVTGWSASYLDPDDLFYTFFHSNWSHLKSSNFRDAEVDALLDAGQRAPISPERDAMYERVEKIVVERDLAVYPYSNTKEFNLIKPRVINPVRLNGIYHFWTTDIQEN
ncbi:ABC transporter substrate-binding protein [Entomospira entomophila]|uniref:ABC transporter substrate-binding protein n=1 Tax=Entomospira entomophila TaxID=2719988 RepID=A0A968KRM5_9SPIO|nr:ABC transporter substrate-binding protein [Entomospira entomophilus]NIZ40903.1 ABC transporter substrate-binding protein [Entomospira entomophilus]WDI35116.1 ABC transporter substrate-binding protein [Entomospira entomophilus]